MKVFETFQKNAIFIGINANQLERSHSFNTRSLQCFLVLGVLSIFSDIYFIRLANSFREYTQSVYITTMSNAVFLVFSIAIWQMEALFRFIDDVNQSYFSSEQWASFIHLTKINDLNHSTTNDFILIYFFRDTKWNIKANVWKNQLSNRKIDRNYIHCHSKNYTNLFGFIEMYC